MATEQAAAELKQQGAIEAAQDPNSTVTSNDAQNKIVQESRRAGVTAFTFNADSSVEEKKAAVRDVCYLPYPSLSTNQLHVDVAFNKENYVGHSGWTSPQTARRSYRDGHRRWGQSLDRPPYTLQGWRRRGC